ncbi:MAG: alanine--glyoxylate aminotransferase family protein [Deltaproteobacteria bacterium]|nr:alanine--glyoxylate aminotransferase family protein [Deltaproteobacteria bacterium]
MKEVFFTPGPSQLHPGVPEFLQEALAQNIPSISHRSGQFEKIYTAAADGVRAVLGAPASFHVFFLGSATEGMERIIQNCSAKHTFHFVNGAFAERFLQTAQELDRTTHELRAPYGEGFDFGSVDIPKETELICATHNETSTGVMLQPEDLQSLKQRYPKKLLALDIVSSAPYPTLSYEHLDAVFFSVQKCFGLPAGLGVLLVNDFCLEKSADILRLGQSVGTYHNFPTLVSFSEKNQTPETPNVLGIYLLGKVCEAFVATGMDKIRVGIDERAAFIYDFLDRSKSFSAFVKNPRMRSRTVISAACANASTIIKALGKQGLHVGSGYGKFKDQHIRIANFPAHTLSDTQRVLQSLEQLTAA